MTKPEFEIPKTPDGLKPLRIQRDSWVRGEGVSTTFLREDGCRCILGFVLGAFGVEDEALLDVGDLGDIDDEMGCVEGTIYEEVTAPVYSGSSGAVRLVEICRGRAIIALNDAPAVVLPEMLAVLMKEHSDSLESAGGVNEDLIACADDPAALREMWLKLEMERLGVELIFE